MKQTAVEWLQNNLIVHPITKEHFDCNDKCWNKAKEMEEKQIILAHGIKDIGVNNMKCVTGEQYYNETFKSE